LVRITQGGISTVYDADFPEIRATIDKKRYALIANSLLYAKTNGTNRDAEARRKYYPDDDPRTQFFFPIYKSMNKTHARFASHLFGVISWSKYFSNVLLKKEQGIYCVLTNTCNQTFSWLVSADGAKFLGLVSACGMA
jgi:hypothetical protein